MTKTLSIPVSVEWNGNSIKILNQQKLPHTTEYLTLEKIEDVFEAIVTLKVRGAPAIGIAAAFGLALQASRFRGDSLEVFCLELEKSRAYLAGSRPTAVNLFWALNRVASVVKSTTTVNEAKTNIIHEAIQIQAEDEQMCRQIGEYALTLLSKNDPVLTICNAGSIATAKYGTALAPFHLAREKGDTFHVYVSETRPVLQGARLTAWELQQSGVNATLITDNMAAHTIKTKGVKAVIVGADRIAVNGDTANKIGTYGLALIAHALNIPFYVAAPSSTFDLNIASGSEIEIEERDSNEVREIQSVLVSPADIPVFNPAFDVTPNELITAIITEKGIITNNFKDEIQHVIAR